MECDILPRGRISRQRGLVSHVVLRVRPDSFGARNYYRQARGHRNAPTACILQAEALQSKARISDGGLFGLVAW